uniref:Anti-WSSV YD25.14 n=1 Tax=Penaeus chinensis TaxID=139456 RepID=E2FHP3_PENCE|nr:anti-WSSV YD25.14 [Penaeus chinensis]
MGIRPPLLSCRKCKTRSLHTAHSDDLLYCS